MFGRVAEDRKSKLLNGIIDYENGELSEEETIALFQELHDTGLAYSLQGHYGRTAQAMIEQGYIEDNRVTSLRRAEATPYTNGASA